MTDMIKRQLNDMKQQLSNIESKVNAHEPVQKTTNNMVTAGVGETTENKRDAKPRGPGFIPGGPTMRQKMKEV